MSNGERPTKPARTNIGRGLLDGAVEAVNKQVDRAFADGFNEAANVCVSLVTKSTDELLAKITAGNLLSAEEQQALARLTALKAEMESQLYDSLPQRHDQH